jgi:integrase
MLGACARAQSESRRHAGLPPLGRVTPHTLRFTFISLLLANGAELPYVMAQVGEHDAADLREGAASRSSPCGTGRRRDGRQSTSSGH